MGCDRKFKPCPEKTACLHTRRGGNSSVNRLENYRKSIKTLLKQYADSMSKNPEAEVEIELVFDTEKDRIKVVYN
ncbi:MAG TPA: hypothetical protein DEG17_19875 [Cyanobacteria bacterium UBA11149]|nr:hypothetical protein [Cyanobacteria bacterium UBA11367]HBE56493.1 hypothetical protein [Cyanobacteria bacterium UBA11366]HBK64948.1 hypothetical protein [Cyanobacteria bacterium UBA11166]HBR76964.1 hypothetical protein [Cyanobacteria bacterium UBA11159]HBS71965.1 hypothetical protein [Cyanobacteria bacterium UBA11153]HBW91058.1 hypothetical protein [Cyanobacteria bacterium UBA11149]HCA97844.1 hypothetical protein [Cyanobacteria bacterium UBA9226]